MPSPQFPTLPSENRLFSTVFYEWHGSCLYLWADKKIVSGMQVRDEQEDDEEAE